MSGICGLVHLRGPLDADRVERMTSWLARRGPDGRGTWRGERAAFGHALLDTTDSGVRDGQPCTLDGGQWIVADARLDGRAELVAALAGMGESARPDATDAQLLLHAWRAWGEDFPARLLGDFAFALWDEARQVLFCARDHLGVKPFFYAQAGGEFLFASALDCLRREGRVPDALDELAIADFLLFEVSQEPGATVFAAVRRLPPAHSLALSPAGSRIRRYWEVPHAQLADPRRDGEWLEEFDALLQAAVADRVRSPRVSVLMSGGLDSPAVAGVAQRRGARVHAFTSVYDRIFPDDERHYSALAAGFMGIPIRHRASDDYALFENYAALAFHFPEPANAPFAAADLDLYADAATHSRVALTGWDGDTLLAESPRPYFAALAAQRRWAALLGATARFALENPASLSRSVWLRVRGGAQATAPAPRFPEWLDEGFVARMRLRDRWHDAMQAPAPRDGLRPYAHRVLQQMQKLACFFEAVDASRTGMALEMRHPMFDLRVLRFCLALPTVPWCIDKAILRRWLRGRLPEAVRRRPKTPLSGYPHLAAPAKPGAYRPAAFTPCEAASDYLDRGKMVSLAVESDPGTSWTQLRAPALDLWFRHVRTA